jgi:hypothetical protein
MINVIRLNAVRLNAVRLNTVRQNTVRQNTVSLNVIRLNVVAPRRLQRMKWVFSFEAKKRCFFSNGAQKKVLLLQLLGFVSVPRHSA